MINKLSFQNADPAHIDFQYLEDLATAYWYSEVIFTALDLQIFRYLNKDPLKLKNLAEKTGCNPGELHRLLRALKSLSLVHHLDGKWCNSQLAGLYLIPEKDSYIGDFLLYRRFMKPKWSKLTKKVALPGRDFKEGSREDNYQLRTLRYVQAMDSLARQKAGEIIKKLAGLKWHPPVLDIGGGAGALARALIKEKTGSATLFELYEVIQSAMIIYPDQADWKGIKIKEGNFIDYLFEPGEKFGLIILSNFLHAYGAREAKSLLHKATGLLKPDGLIVIHDYFPDRLDSLYQKGPLYDLNMLLNTYKGVCHESEKIIEWLKQDGMKRVYARDLKTDSAIIVASIEGEAPSMILEEWVYEAHDAGFSNAVLLPPDQVITAPWVHLKCNFGCALYGKNLQCPPHSLKWQETRDILNSYTCALLLEGSPPGKEFHTRLLDLEKQAFLKGFHKAFVFGAGFCPVCTKCPEDGICRYPDQARPSMESAGIDVYGTAHNAGISIEPLADKGQYIKYMGLLLLE